MVRGPRKVGAVLLAAAALVLGACAAIEDRAIAETVPPTFTPITMLESVDTTTSTTAPRTEQTTTIPRAAPSDPPRESRETLIINGTGDVNLDPGFVRSFPSEGYEFAWSGLDGLFLEDDLTVVNLECSAGSGGVPWDKKWTFTCDPEAYPPMKAAGVDVANQANNHGADFGFAAMLEGSEILTAEGIVPVGAGANREDAFTPALLSIDGWTVAVLGFSAVGPENGSWAAGDDRPGIAAATDLETATAAIAAADEIADVVIVTVHWGNQGENSPPGWVRRLGEAYVEAGADGVFGHHSHVLNPLEWYQGRPIAWGLGNFVWQAYPPEGVQTAVAQFVFEPDGRIGACLVPVVIEQTGHPVVQAAYEAPCRPAPSGA